MFSSENHLWIYHLFGSTSTTPSSTVSFLKGGASNNNSSFVESTLDINHLSVYYKNPNYPVLSPILTPNANSKTEESICIF